MHSQQQRFGPLFWVPLKAAENEMQQKRVGRVSAEETAVVLQGVCLGLACLIPFLQTRSDHLFERVSFVAVRYDLRGFFSDSEIVRKSYHVCVSVSEGR